MALARADRPVATVFTDLNWRRGGRVEAEVRTMRIDARRLEALTFALGPCLFAVIAVGGLLAVVFKWDGLTLGDYLQAVAAGAGLLAVGHGIHRASRVQSGDDPLTTPK